MATANATGDVSNPGANVANYLSGADWNAQNGNVTTVGTAAANNYFGTADQGGNVYEWNDAVISGSWRGVRAGAFDGGGASLRSSSRGSFDPSVELSLVGFRVASVPEPSAMVLTLLFSAALVTRRKR